ncbi:MAG: extracellular solute-binding protein [Planctomycetota bacterium]|nr:extracellular solute-binding protein [Planctomycetota bacterium]
MRLLLSPSLLVLLGLAGCARNPDLVIYCSLDQEFSEELILRFARESGLEVRAEYDIEANKNVGLATRIREEAGSRPRCDVFWSNECAQVVALGEEGLLQTYDSPSARDIPADFRDPEHRWTGFAARARVLIVNTQLVPPDQIVSMWDLFDPRWKGQVAMARPLAGTTNTHMTALYLALGEKEALRYVETAARLAQDGSLNLVTGNAHVMRLVRDGQAAFGWTDSDDFNVAREAGFPVAAVYPDRDGVGTLLIPNTVCILASAPRAEAARRFVDWILRPEIEAELARSRSAQIPVRANVPRPAHVVGPDAFRAMKVDGREVGRTVRQRTAELQELFLK